VTTAALWRRTVAGIRHRLPDLRHVVLVDPDAAAGAPPGVTCALADLIATPPPPGDRPPPTTPESPALLHFTSGTTGAPKAAVHVHDAVVGLAATARHVLGLGPGSVFWCTADPGWITGIAYGLIAPLVAGATTVVDAGPFDPGRWYRLLADHRVVAWYTAPTALRMLRRAGTAFARGYDLTALQTIASVGEPLDAATVAWGEEALGQPVRDTWWPTETGAIMIASPLGEAVRPGAMGRPVPGVTAALVERREDGVAVTTHPDAVGELALATPWPSLFRGYLGAEARYRACFADGWYLSGDLVRRDADGWFHFVGRRDDVIKTAGHLVGPFEVESVLLAHPAVAEAAAIGLPDPVTGEAIKAFVTLRPGHGAGDDVLRRDLLAFARRGLGAAVAPRDIGFAAELPKTSSGKIVRRLLRARELGYGEGDVSTIVPATDGGA